MTRNHLERMLIAGLFTIAVVVFVMANSASKVLDGHGAGAVLKKAPYNGFNALNYRRTVSGIK